MDLGYSALGGRGAAERYSALPTTTFQGVCTAEQTSRKYLLRTSMLIANFTPEDPGNVAKPSVRISFRVIYQGRGYATCGT